jgi:hypothetical protein
MIRWLFGFDSRPTFCTTRAAIGNAEMPAAPMSGFTFRPDARYISLPNSTPDAVPTAKAITPIT